MGKTLCNVGSKKGWVDVMVDPPDAIKEVEVDADVFFDFFLSIPQVESRRRYKECKQEWRTTLEEIEDELDKNEQMQDVSKHTTKWKERLGNINAHVDELRKIVAFYKELKQAELKLTKLEAQKQSKRYCAGFDRDAFLYIGSVYGVPGPLSETQKKFAQFQENGKFWYGILDKDLSVKNSSELRDAFELDKQREKDFKKEAKKGNWLCKTGDENKELLREIHEHAIKVQSKIAKELEKKVMKPVKDNQFAKFSVFGWFDAVFYKMAYATLVNVVVIFLIVAIMNTISSEGLPGRQKLPDKTSFQVILKVKNSTTTNKDRFDKPEEIYDVCQGLGWWMQDDSQFTYKKYDWEEEQSYVNAKQHWDPLLNPKGKCPGILAGLSDKLGVKFYNTGISVCEEIIAQPASATWKGDGDTVGGETQEYFLSRDGDYEVMQWFGIVLTDKSSNQSKEFTVMSGNYNAKVQQLQPIHPLDPMSSGADNELFLEGYYPWDFEPFWKTVDRIFPSEWAVQALFTLTVNSNADGGSQYDENHIVGGYNAFGRRPTAIVQSNVGGAIGGVNLHGYMIEEAIWQFLERRCWHKTKFRKRQPIVIGFAPKLEWWNIANIQEYNPLSQYDRDAKPIKGDDGEFKVMEWDDLDQGLRDYWRGLGLGVNTSTCHGAQLPGQPGKFVNTSSRCISGMTKCTRVNYHTVNRWNANNDDKIAADRFNKRDFTAIFNTYDCDGVADGRPPTPRPLTWQEIELAGNAAMLAAATNLGYDGAEWKAHSKEPKRKSGPPDNLVLDLENYLEGEGYKSTFFWTQVCCSLIMVCVAMPEIRNMFLWAKLLPPLKGPNNQILNPISWFRYWKWFFTMAYKKPQFAMRICINDVLIRFSSMILAFVSYVVIPLMLVMVSLLLILESGSVVDVIKDTLSLLFLNEINNYLQVRNVPGSAKWTIKMPSREVDRLDKHKNLFSFLLVASFLALASYAINLTYTGSGTDIRWLGIHPSILFNVARFRSPKDGFVSWAVLLILLLVLFLVYIVSYLGVKFLESRFWKDGSTLLGRIDQFGSNHCGRIYQCIRRNLANTFDDPNAYDEENEEDDDEIPGYGYYWDADCEDEEKPADCEDDQQPVMRILYDSVATERAATCVALEPATRAGCRATPGVSGGFRLPGDTSGSAPTPLLKNVLGTQQSYILYGEGFGMDPGTRDKSGMYDEEIPQAATDAPPQV